MPALPRLVPAIVVASLAACGDKGDEEGAAGGGVEPGDTGVDEAGDTGVDEDGDGFSVDDDCDDADRAVNPGATEVCDGIDNNCDEAVDEGLLIVVFADADGDGFGDAMAAADACEVGADQAAEAGDCDDTDAAVNPAADEVCDALDNDCDGTVDNDDAVDATLWFADLDGDGYGDPENTTAACWEPEGFVGDETDCNDEADTVYPGADEVCDGEDSDCDGTIGEVRVPSDHATLQDALDAGEPRICLEAGTHRSNVWHSLTQDTVIEGVSTADAILDGGGVDRTLDLELRGFQAEIHNLTISGGSTPSDAAGLYAFSFGSDGGVTVTGVVFTDNACAGSGCSGAGLGISGVASAVLVDVESTGNSVEGDALGTVSLVGVDVVEIDGLDIHDEDLTAVDGLLAGGLMLLYSDEISLNDVRVTDLDVVAEEDFGGAIGIYVASMVDATNLHLSGNVVAAASCVTPGYVADAVESGTYRNIDIRGNTCTTPGAAHAGGFRHGGSVDRPSTVDVDNLVIAGNSLFAGEVWAGAILDRWTHATYTNISVTGNAAVADTAVTDPGAGVLFAAGSADVTLVNADVSDNTINLGSGTATTFAWDVSGGGHSWSHANLHGATFGPGITDPVGSDGNISVAPIYVDVTAADAVDWDLALDATSPLIDAGDASILDPDGTTSDIGAYGGPGAADW